jgi:hypothetical protein
VKYGKPHGASIERRVRSRTRTDIVHSELGEQRAIEHTCDGAILVELTVDVRGLVFDAQVANAPSEHLHERALLPIVRRCVVSLKDAGCHSTMVTTHRGLLPATTTNSPGSRYPWLRRHGSMACL